MRDPRAEARQFLGALAPGGAPVRMRTALSFDESAWFLKIVSEEVVRFRDCPADCFRAKKYGVAGPDHFDTPAGKPRHLFSKAGDEVAWLNREYIPHIAAYGLVVLSGGYDVRRSSFSLYRRFRRDLIAKRQGQSFETDAEFYDRHAASISKLRPRHHVGRPAASPRRSLFMVNWKISRSRVKGQ